MQKITTTIIVFRHAQTQLNLEKKFQGTLDEPLAPLGKKQMLENAKWLNEFLTNQKINRLNFISSPLRRAVESSQIVIDAITKNGNFEVGEFSQNENFRELDFGAWQGLTSPQVKEKFYAERQSRKQNAWQFKPTGGESLAERLPLVFAELQKISTPTIIMTHTGIIKILQHLLGGISQQLAAEFNMPHNAALIYQNEKLLEISTKLI